MRARDGLIVWLLIAASVIADPPAAKPNRLALESSPYLLQHTRTTPSIGTPGDPRHSPRPRPRNKLVFTLHRLLGVSLVPRDGAHESFANAEVAKLLNDWFVCIKVDREERPDVDQVYMTALQVLRINGGWPLTMFLTPDGKPIVGGTYWPREDKVINGQTVRGFKSILASMLELEHATSRRNCASKPTKSQTQPIAPCRASVAPWSAPTPIENSPTRRPKRSWPSLTPRTWRLRRPPPRVPAGRSFHRARRWNWHYAIEANAEWTPHVLLRTFDRMAFGGSVYDQDWRRLPPLQHRTDVDGAALREDALRQCPIDRTVRTGVRRHEETDVPSHRGRNAGVRRARAEPRPEGGFYSAARRGRRWRRGQDSPSGP